MSALATVPRIASTCSSMANTADQLIARAEREEYTGQPLELFDRVPGWAIVHAMRDNSMFPLIREGEVAVVESRGKPGWLPCEGELFLIQYASPPYGGERYGRITYDIVMPRLRKDRWWVGPLCHRLGRTFFMGDGPYPDEDALAAKLIGKVRGIYNPAALAEAVRQ